MFSNDNYLNELQDTEPKTTKNINFIKEFQEIKDIKTAQINKKIPRI